MFQILRAHRTPMVLDSSLKSLSLCPDDQRSRFWSQWLSLTNRFAQVGCLSLPWLPSWLLAFARQQHLFLLTLSWFLQMTLVGQLYTISSSRQQCYLGVNDVPWNNRDSGLKELGSLAKNGVVLEKAYTLPICTPSRFLNVSFSSQIVKKGSRASVTDGRIIFAVLLF